MLRNIIICGFWLHVNFLSWKNPNIYLRVEGNVFLWEGKKKKKKKFSVLFYWRASLKVRMTPPGLGKAGFCTQVPTSGWMEGLMVVPSGERGWLKALHLHFLIVTGFWQSKLRARKLSWIRIPQPHFSCYWLINSNWALIQRCHFVSWWQVIWLRSTLCLRQL